MKNSTIWFISIVVLLIIASYSIFVVQTTDERFVEQTLDGMGLEFGEVPEEIGDEFGENLVSQLITKEEILRIVNTSEGIRPTRAFVFDYTGKGWGKILDYQKQLTMNSEKDYITSFIITLDKPGNIKLKHKIEIGTDKRNWEVIKKETNYPVEYPFKRTYLLVQRRGDGVGGRMVGVAYYEGAKVEFAVTRGLVNNETIEDLQEITWIFSERLEKIYNESIKEIAEGPFLEENPILTRPDLPDPDII